jgi:hypothetical protein
MLHYRERLTPSIYVALSFFPILPALLLVCAPFSFELGLAIGVAVYAIILIAAYSRTRTVTVTDDAFTYGTAILETEFIGAVSAFTGQAARAERGLNLDARAWTSFKAFFDGVVKIELTDPDDPTPYWLVSSRNPLALAEALRSVRKK